MIKSLTVATLLIASATMSAGAQVSEPGQGTTIQKLDDRRHGIWIMNPGNGTIYWCQQVSGGPTCVEARVITAQEWGRLRR
jgi:hypothetical protein